MSHVIEKDWTTQSGLRAIVVICLRKDGSRRHRCGYVNVPESHPLFSVKYDQQADCLTREMADSATIGNKSPILALTASLNSDSDGVLRRSPDVVFDVHGGITYSGGSGYPADGWWFGFDCAHCDDADIDEMPGFIRRGGIVRELDYLEGECERLAQQIAAVSA